MDALQKLLRKISAKERLLILNALEAILSGQWEHLQLRRLRGYTHIFRVRVGDYRIIFYHDGVDTIIKAIKRRNERTYDHL